MSNGVGLYKYIGEYLCKRCKRLGRVNGELGCVAKNKKFHSNYFWFRKYWCKHYEFGVNGITF